MMKKVLSILGLLTGFWLTMVLFPVSLSAAQSLTHGETENHAPRLSSATLEALKGPAIDPFTQDPKKTRAMPQAEQNKALAARKLANIIPYGQIARRAKKRFGGRIVNQKLTQTNPETWVYELKVLRKNGKVVSVTMDAQTGKILKTRGERRR